MRNLTQKMSLIKRNRLFIWLAILMITLLWGYAWVIMKQSLVFMGPFTFTSFRFTIGILTLFLITFLVKREYPIQTYWKKLAVLGILQTSIVFLFVMYALRFVDAGKSSVLLYSMPLWSSLLATKFLNEKLTRQKWIGLFVGLSGLLTIVGWDLWQVDNFAVIFGELLIVIAAFSWSIANVYYRFKLAHLPKLETNAYQMLFGTIGIIVATCVMEWGEPITFNALSIYYILFTGVLASALCFSIWYLILSYIDMVTATISILLVPIFGLLLSYLIIGEELTINVLIGSCMIIVGIMVVQVSKNDRKIR